MLQLVEVGTLQQVYANDDYVNLLETFCIDSNDIHTKVVFWGEFAAQVCSWALIRCLLAAINITPGGCEQARDPSFS
jgi:hypothetical protein